MRSAQTAPSQSRVPLQQVAVTRSLRGVVGVLARAAETAPVSSASPYNHVAPPSRAPSGRDAARRWTPPPPLNHFPVPHHAASLPAGGRSINSDESSCVKADRTEGSSLRPPFGERSNVCRPKQLARAFAMRCETPPAVAGLVNEWSRPVAACLGCCRRRTRTPNRAARC